VVDTKEVAEQLGTDPKIFRRFLRSVGPVALVGSGGRYQFTKADLPHLRELFEKWAKGKKVKPSAPRQRPPANDRLARDRAVWEEESQPIILEDIRDPLVRARVRAEAKRQEDRLEARLLARGLHITQWHVRRV
jgi:hypothetical protein